MRSAFRFSGMAKGVAAWILVAGGVFADEGNSPQTFTAHDTLAPRADESPDAQACLDGLVWTPSEFTVAVHRQTKDGPYAFVRFPSAVPSGDETNDLVALEWYAPKAGDGGVLRAPAVVVVHESGARMEVGRLFAKALYAKGLHAFLIQLPYYGLRRANVADRADGSRFLRVMKQAIADVRRARDAVAALPEVDAERVSLQGTSLGGFVAATTAGMDDGFDQVFIMVAGGDLLRVIHGGQREAAELRRRLSEAGIEGEKLNTLVAAIEPTRLAHRVRPERFWLYTAKDDQVVPASSSLALRKAARLADDHHVELWGDHYRVLVYFPVIVEHMTARLGVAEKSE